MGDYSWDRVLADYWLCVPMCLYIDTEYCRQGIDEGRQATWMPYLERTLAALRDSEAGKLCGEWAG